jgi:hypothetical protein
VNIENYPVLIQFGMKAKRGKDTACQIIKEEFGERYSVRQYAYADALRSEVLEMLYEIWVAEGKNPDEFPSHCIEVMEQLCYAIGVPFDKQAKVEPGYPATKQRPVYQYVGMARRAADAFYWVNKLRQRVEAERPQIALISDMRFRNEFAYGQSFKGYNVKLVRPDLDAQESLSEAEATHVSECELDSLPDSAFYRVITHTSVDDLRRQVIQLVNDIITELTPPAEFLELLNSPGARVNYVTP